MAKKRFYAVAKGRTIGIYDQWNDGAWDQVDRFPNAIYKSFAVLELAVAWWKENAGVTDDPALFFRSTLDMQAAGASLLTPECSRYFTYLIIDPRNEQPFYVGQTVDLERRKIEHFKITPDTRKPYKKRLSEIIAAGFTPVFLIVDEQETLAASLRSETEWVKKIAARGMVPMNRTREHRDWIEHYSRQASRGVVGGLSAP